MGEDRDAAGIPDRGDRILGAEALAPDVPRFTVPDDPGERVLDALGEPGGHQCPPDRRSAEGIVVVRIQVADLGIDREVDRAQQIDGLPEPPPALIALDGQGRFERLVIRVHPEAQDVELALP